MMLDEMRDMLQGNDVPGKELAAQYKIRPAYTQDAILAKIHSALQDDIANGVRYMINDLNRQMDIFMGKNKADGRVGISFVVRGDVEINIKVPQSTPTGRAMSAVQSKQVAEDFIKLMKAEWPAFTYSIPPVLGEDYVQYVCISYQGTPTK